MRVINEQTTTEIDIDIMDADGQQIIPTSTRYRLKNLTKNKIVKDWTTSLNPLLIKLESQDLDLEDNIDQLFELDIRVILPNNYIATKKEIFLVRALDI